MVSVLALESRRKSSEDTRRGSGYIENTARANGKRLGVEYAEAFRQIVIAGALVLAEATNA